MPTPIPASRGLNHGIGLALSGGGFRAAGFHLGTLAYLHRAGLLDQVEALSTVSGGTFAGAAYVLALIEKKPFEAFFSSFYGFLTHEVVLRKGLAGLSEEHPDVPSGRKALIISMADVYTRTLCSRPDGTPYVFGDVLDAGLPIKEIAFNATEFQTGKAFRFQTSQTRGFIGNSSIRLSRLEAAGIRLGDIVAASSCFPGGFEPIAFPFDFAWPGGKLPASLKTQFERGGAPRPIALMDGGVYDNQGFDSLLLAERRDRNNLDPGETPETDALGLLVISDVDKAHETLYDFPSVDIGSPITLNTVNRISQAMLLVATVYGALLGYRFFDRAASLDVLEALLLGLPFVLVAAMAIIIFWVRRQARAAIRRVPHADRALWSDIKGLTLTQVVEMGVARMASLFALSSRVFMKRIRQMGYDLLYESPEYAGRQLSTLIYDLTPENPQYRYLRTGFLDPTPTLRRVIGVAAGLPTGLWFEAEYELPCLVATGQATLCYNLMKYIAANYELAGAKVENEDAPRMPMTPDIQALWDRLEADWRALNDDPYALLTPLAGAMPVRPPR
ncbi:MAG: patatin-like phospholipase family protein [Rhodothermales bacterium]